MLLSVVIPIFNTAAYISKCIDSILSQGLDLSQYEVICIDDGSTDNSSEIVIQYCKKYPNIKLIRQRNKGISFARNRGLFSAKGEYVHFVDSDDYIVENSYKYIFHNLLNWSRKYDIIKFYSTTIDKYNINKPSTILDSKIVFKGSLIDYIILNENFPTFVWNKIIRRRVLLEHKIKFHENISICEDVLFNVEVAHINNLSMVECNTDAYRYVVRNNSSVTTFSPRRVIKSLNSYEIVFNILKKYRAEPFIVQYDKLLCSISRQMITRLLSSNIPYFELKKILYKYKAAKYIPIKSQVKSNRILNLLTKSSLIFYVSRLIYRSLFLPYIKQYIPRN